MDPVYVYFSVNDQDVVRWRRGVRTGEIRLAAKESADGVAPLPVEITLADGSSYEPEGRMNFADPQIDSQTGTLRLRAEVPNPRRVLAPGMFVTIRVLGAERPDAILIPQRAVLQNAKGQFVYVVGEGGVAIQRPIRTSRWADEDWLVEEGLAAGDRLIVDGLQKIRDGAPVAVKAEAPPAGNAS
ncbi:MAG: efflux RND transporter periplasmic adaptor subunit, partial [Candidatus Methylomirabilis sp.]|nr:efflux RND transporter periplasmic adaptor subunit [Deltaproteobacteria bacterium]